MDFALSAEFYHSSRLLALRPNKSVDIILYMVVIKAISYRVSGSNSLIIFHQLQISSSLFARISALFQQQTGFGKFEGVWDG